MVLHVNKVPGGLSDPQTTTPARRPRSVRRTSHIDMRPLGPTSTSGLDLLGRARDLRTGAGGDAEVLAEGSVHAVVGAARSLEALDTEPGLSVDALLGLAVGRGFRAAVQEAVPEHAADQTPLFLLLDDLPVAALISGYADLYKRSADPPLAATAGAGGPTTRGLTADICAGWARESTMMTAVAEKGEVPTTVGPVAPILERADDPCSWHDMPDLPPGAMRRRRLIEVVAGDPLVGFATFRDTHVDDEGTETVLHEYVVDLEVEPGTLRILRSEATPRVLPWPECPGAAASARRLEGSTVPEARDLVRKEFKGTSTCTHLNDLLRSIADVARLVEELPT